MSINRRNIAMKSILTALAIVSVIAIPATLTLAGGSALKVS
jgi:hypothetical protein